MIFQKNLKKNQNKLKNHIENNTIGGSKPPFYLISYYEVIVMNSKRLEILRVLPTELLLDMVDNINELSEEHQQEALEEIVYILFEREVKANE